MHELLLFPKANIQLLYLIYHRNTIKNKYFLTNSENPYTKTCRPGISEGVYGIYLSGKTVFAKKRHD